MPMFQDIHKYLHKVTPERPEVMTRMEAYAAENGFPIIGPLVGRFLYQMAELIKAKKVLELGSGYGYSAYWFAMAMGAKGKIIMTDSSAKNKKLAAAYLAEAGLKTTFDYRLGDALRIAKSERGPFDIILNDIDKKDYPRTIDLVAERLRPGGLFITDNVIWSGKVCRRNRDATTKAIVQFTERLYADDRFFTTIMPLRDGVAVAVRR